MLMANWRTYSWYDYYKFQWFFLTISSLRDILTYRPQWLEQFPSCRSVGGKEAIFPVTSNPYASHIQFQEKEENTMRIELAAPRENYVKHRHQYHPGISSLFPKKRLWKPHINHLTFASSYCKNLYWTSQESCPKKGQFIKTTIVRR